VALRVGRRERQRHHCVGRRRRAVSDSARAGLHTALGSHGRARVVVLLS
jgi:hypothetical protein